MGYINTMLNCVKLYVNKTISNIKQPNWNQNDKNAQDYIKNRPFYTSDPIETMVVKEQTVSIADDGYGNYYAQLSAKIFFELDKTYIVNFNGEEYKCTPWKHPYSGGHYIGNGALYDGYEQFNGKEPFVIESYSDSQVHLGVNAEGTYTISVIEKYEDVVKIPEKYLPTSVGQNVADKKFVINNETVTAETGAEIFNDYEQNAATGGYSHAEGSNTTASGFYSHAEG
jgi:hypothetical protein